MLIVPLLLAGALTLEAGAGVVGEFAVPGGSPVFGAAAVDGTLRVGGAFYGLASVDPLLVLPKPYGPLGASASIGAGWRIVDDDEKSIGVGMTVVGTGIPIPEFDTTNYFLSVAVGPHVFADWRVSPWFSLEARGWLGIDVANLEALIFLGKPTFLALITLEPFLRYDLK